MTQHRIVLIDDHPLYREGVRTMISWHHDLRIVGEAGDARSGLELVEETQPDGVVLDITLPGSDGVTLAGKILRMKSPPRVIILSMHKGLDYVRQAIATGVSGYSLKDDAPHLIVEAIRTALKGEIYLSPQVREEFRSMPVDPSAAGLFEHLSEREREIFGMIVQGHSSQRIAEELFITLKTVETHRANINRKLGVHSTSEIVRLAAQRGLLPP